MAIVNFVPEIWSAQILQNLRNTLVYAQDGVINRDYEGDIAKAGDTVHITAFNDPAVRAYTKNVDISFDILTDTTQPLVIDQSDYFAFSVDDVDKRQALGGFVESATIGAAYNLSNKVDSYVSGLMKAGAGINLGSKVVDGKNPSSAYELILQFRTALQRAKVPASQRYVIVPPELYAVLLRDPRFVEANKAGTTDGLRNAQVGTILGLNVIEGNTVPDAGSLSSSSSSGESQTGNFTVIAGHPMCFTFAQQIASTEALRLEKQFGDGIKGLHLYGGKVVRPAQLAKATVTVYTPLDNNRAA